MSIGKHAGENELLIKRYASSRLSGEGFSQIISYVKEQCQRGNYVGKNGSRVKRLVGFSDNELSNEFLYRENGWHLVGNVPVSYTLWNKASSQRERKSKYTLRRFRNDPALVYIEGKTVKELVEYNKLLKCYDAGRQKWSTDI